MDFGGYQTKTVDELEDLAEVVLGHLNSPEFEAIFEKARQGGMNTDEINNIYAALHLVSESIAVQYATDISGGEIELEYESSVDVISTLVEGPENKGNTYSYSVAQVVPGLQGASGVDIDIDITFAFPIRNPFFGFNVASVAATLEGMEVHIGQFKAVSKGVELTVAATNPVLVINLGAQIFEDVDGYFTSANVWSYGDVIESNVHQKIVENDIVISVDRVGTVSELDGSIFFGDGDIENSQVDFNTERFKMKMTLDGLADEDELNP